MSAEANKNVVLSFWENFSAGQVEAALAVMADTTPWGVAGRPEQFALAGTETKVQLVELVKGLGAVMPIAVLE